MQPFNPTILTRRTEADLSSSAWMLVIAVGTDETDRAGDTSGAVGDLCIGALTDDVADGSTNAAFVPVQIGGVIKVICGDTCTAGALAMADENGEAMDATADTYAFGIALATYADGEIGTFLWAPSHMETT